MGFGTPGSEQKPATAARIYDYLLGGVHNFPADRAAADQLIAKAPMMPRWLRANRALVRRVVRELAATGVRQFLDIGSGIPTEGNVHEIAQSATPDARVVYVDIDPVAVSESLDILEGNQWATAIRGDLRDPESILGHPQVTRLIDFDQPIALLLMAILHFVPDHAEADGSVAKLTAPLAAGSYLAISHAAAETFYGASPDQVSTGKEVYRTQTATPLGERSRDQVARFFDGRAELVEPGLVWASAWRPDPDDPDDFTDDPPRSGSWAAVGRIA